MTLLFWSFLLPSAFQYCGNVGVKPGGRGNTVLVVIALAQKLRWGQVNSSPELVCAVESYHICVDVISLAIGACSRDCCAGQL